MKLTRRGKVVLVAVMAMLSLGMFWLGTRAAGLAADAAPVSHAGLPWVVVGEHDTLWTIAEDLAPKADSTAVIGEIKRLNDLPDGLIRPGKRLYVPKMPS